MLFLSVCFSSTVSLLLKTDSEREEKVHWHHLLWNFMKNQKCAVKAEGIKTPYAIGRPNPVRLSSSFNFSTCWQLRRKLSHR